MTRLEGQLAEHFQGNECRIYGRATSGLFTLFSALRKAAGPGEVIIPSICCESVAMAAWFAGLQPVIATVGPHSLCLDPADVQGRLSADTRAVVLVYVFGVTCDPKPFRDLQAGRDFVLIEDLAQAVGGTWKGRPLGTFADCTLLSFADDKIIQGSGGALIRRTEKGPKLEAFSTDCGLRASSRALKLDSLRNFCHSLYELARSDWGCDVSRHFWRQIENYKEIYLAPDSLIDVSGVAEQLDNLPEQQSLRLKNYERYLEQIQTEAVAAIHMAEGAMVWRAPWLAKTPELALSITRSLRQSGLPASNHYFPLDKLLFNVSDERTQAAGQCLLNLWVDESVSSEQISASARLINSLGNC